MANEEIENKNPKNPTSVSKGKEAEYGKKPVYNGTAMRDFGSETVHDTDFHKG
jgi:hypothetical protein